MRFILAILIMTAFPLMAQAEQTDGLYQEAATYSGMQVKADLLILHKGKRLLELMQNGRVIRSYRVALGESPVGHKYFEGDGRTPEGSYTIDFRLEDSAFHRAIRISYPNARDRAQAAAFGKSPGGQIMIHGLPNGFSADYVGHPYEDWTQGCVAVTNEEMDEIWRKVDLGTRIIIFP